jgi:hypothetical protein
VTPARCLLLPHRREDEEENCEPARGQCVLEHSGRDDDVDQALVGVASATAVMRLHRVVVVRVAGLGGGGGPSGRGGAACALCTTEASGSRHAMLADCLPFPSFFSPMFPHTLRSLPRHESSLFLFLSIIFALPSLHADLLLLPATLRSRSKHQSSLSFFLSRMIVLSTDTLFCSLSCIPRRSPAVACSHPILQRNPLSFVACMMVETYRYFGNTQAIACSLAFFFGCLRQLHVLRTGLCVVIHPFALFSSKSCVCPFQIIICSHAVMEWKTYRYFGNIYTYLHVLFTLHSLVVCRNPPLCNLHCSLLNYKNLVSCNDP